VPGLDKEQPRQPEFSDKGQDRAIKPRVRRSYSMLVFGGPWLLGLAGLGLIVFALLGTLKSAMQIAVFSGGIVLATVGLLSVHFTGPVEVSPRGLKGSFSDIPSDALYVAHRAATRAADEVAGLDQEVTPPMREIVADHAAFEAISALSLLQELAQFVDDERIIGLLSAATMNSETEAVARQLRDQIIAEAQFELSYGRRFTRREEASSTEDESEEGVGGVTDLLGALASLLINASSLLVNLLP
jgi:hypothetical protein